MTFPSKTPYLQLNLNGPLQSEAPETQGAAGQWDMDANSLLIDSAIEGGGGTFAASVGYYSNSGTVSAAGGNAGTGTGTGTNGGAGRAGIIQVQRIF